MKLNRILPLIAVGLAVLLSVAAADKGDAALRARATISEEKARAIALAKVPGGKVKSFEIEEEEGKLIWSFDIAVAGSKDISEVWVDAKTGEVLSVEVETPEAQEKEAKEDSKATEDRQKAREGSSPVRNPKISST